MELGVIGLGRMGNNISLRLLRNQHRAVVYDRDESKISELKKQGATASSSVEDLVTKLSPPRIIWMMVPAGAPVDGLIDDLTPMLKAGDILIDGGNSNHHDSVRRSEKLKEANIEYLDVGTSGGIWGLEQGFCLMVGGSKKTFEKVEPLLSSLAPKGGYAHVGPNGAGHFVKTIHNGIEYALLQSYAEGLEVLQSSKFDLDLEQITKLWNEGSVIRSWILQLANRVFEKDHSLDQIRGYVEDSGMGRWTVQEAIEQSTPAPLITLSLLQRFRSRQDDSFAAKVIAALRNEFGGHQVKSKK